MTAEQFAAIMSQVQTAQANQMQVMMEQFVNSMMTKTGGLDGKENLGRPEKFNGNDGDWVEWVTKLKAWMQMKSQGESGGWIAWASGMSEEVNEEEVDLRYPDTKDQVLKFSRFLYTILVQTVSGAAFAIVQGAPENNGLEAFRQLIRRYEPRTAGSRRALIKQIVNHPQAKDIKQVENNVRNLEELIKKYNIMSKEKLAEDIRVTVLIDICHPYLRKHLELNTKDASYIEVREMIMSYVDRTRQTYERQMDRMEGEYLDGDINHNWQEGTT